jgi:hypothetical protein
MLLQDKNLLENSRPPNFPTQTFCITKITEGVEQQRLICYIGIVFKFVSDFPEFCYLTVGQQAFF